MNEHRFAQVREIFDAVAALPPDERDAALANRCAGDPELAAEVRSLLEADSASESMFGWSPAEHTLASEEASSRAGETVGDYTLVRRLGAGGMGEVWLAEHSIEDAVRHVALKFIRPGLDSESVARRFRRERRVLAGLEHPAIARLLDGGSDEQGRPYLVMEYVQGVPIDTYCDEYGLGVEDRLRLFVRVCDAVQTAHRSLVVHRDLKPENILVTPRGDPKLLDFGIARLLTQDADPSLTLTGQRVFTPRYASPEQIRGEPVTTATDVYSLGVVLYRLLTGCGPYDDDKDLETAICKREPTRPSAAHSTAAGDRSRLRRRLVGDLDTIILMALRKEPERRYPSVEQFAEDLRRHLDGLPVRARPDTLGYRTRKFASRHAVSLTGVAGVFLALLVGVIVFGFLFREASIARADAEERAAESEQTAAFFADMLASVAPSTAQGADLTVIRDVLDKASQRIDTQLAEYPRAEATLQLTIGNTYLLLGAPDEAAPHLDAALELNNALHGPDSPEVAKVWLKQAALAEALGDYTRASDLLDRAQSTFQLAGDEVKTAEAVLGHARIAMETGQVARALELAASARNTFEQTLGPTDARSLKAAMLIAGAHTMTGNLAKAEQETARLAERFNQAEGPLHPDTLVTEANLAMIRRQLGRHEESEAALASVVERSLEVFGPDHASTLQARVSHAQTLLRLGRIDDAETAARAALEGWRRTLGERHPNTLHTLSVLASSVRAAGRNDEAVELLRESHRLHLDSLGPDSLGTNATANLLAATLIEAGPQHYEEAEGLLLESIERLNALAGPDFQLTRTAINRLRTLYGTDAMDRPDKLASLNERFGDG